MATEEKIIAANAVYDTLCEMLNESGWSFEKKEERKGVVTTVPGTSLTIMLIIECSVERQVIKIYSLLPFRIPKEKRVEGAIAINEINCSFGIGSFDYQALDGSIMYRLTSPFAKCSISKELIWHLIDMACAVIDMYSENLHLFSQGLMEYDEVSDIFKSL